MSKPFVRIITNETVIDREMNEDEYAQWQTDKAQAEAQQTAQTAKAKTRQAVLDKLGLTADEVAALFG